MESISIREAAERLGVSHKVIRRLIAQGLVAARKIAGTHGAEWSVDAASLEAYRAGSPRPSRERTSALPRPRKASISRPDTVSAAEPGASSGPATFPFEAYESVHEERRFLREHVSQLTMLLRDALYSTPARAAHLAGLPGTDGLTGQAGQAGMAEPGLDGWQEGSIAAASGVSPVDPTVAVRHVTEALQSSLRSIGTQDVAALEMCSVKVLWGKPVLWRVVAEHPEDVAALVEAILSPDAAWIPPDEEVHFLWARNGTGEVVWGTACGAGWFSEPFPEALRTARVERR